MGVVRLTQEERRAQSEQRLIEAALTVAVRDGVSAVTFEAIGKEAGLSRGLASARFGNKEGLLRAVVDYLHTSIGEQLAALGIENMRGLDALLAYADMHLAALPKRDEASAYFIFLSGAVSEMSDIRAVFAEEHEKVRDLLAKIIRRGIKDGSVRTVMDPDTAALMIGSLIIGIAQQCLADPKTNADKLALNARRAIAASFANPDVKKDR